MNDINTDTGIGKPPKRKGDKVEVVRILILAVVSFVLGFGLVIFFLAPSNKNEIDDLPDLTGVADSAADETADSPEKGSTPAVESATTSPGGGYAPSDEANPLLAAGTADESSGEGNNFADEADAPPSVPPGRTPDGVSLDGSAFYLKCWDSNGGELAGDACDKLSVLEKRMETRLYVVDRCRQQNAGAKAEGKLSLGMEVDFDKQTLSFWNGASSTLENAAKVATCLRTELNGLPITSVDHKASRYRIFFTVLFGKDGKSGDPAPSNADGNVAKKLPVGKSVTVVMDNVRVRKAPVDGEIIGKIAKDNEVKLLKKKGDWCNVLTPNDNEGWMICEALSK